MSLKYERRLLDHLRHESYAPATVSNLARDLGVPPEEHDALEAAVEDLRDRGVLEVDPSGRVQLPRMEGQVTGVFRKHVRGFGFLIPDNHFREGDLFIPPDSVGDALSGDRVRAVVNRSRRGGESDVTGAIVAVLERKRSSFTGELVQRGGPGGAWLVMPDGRELTQPIVVDDPTVKNARSGDKVAVEITYYPENSSELAKGVITKVLGEAGLPDVETQAVIIAYSLPGEFPKACQDQARQAVRQFDTEAARAERQGLEGRLDLRSEFVITIDPPDAKDYDDAISIHVTPDGWDLAVHIADVAHFIPIGSALDVEAKDRGNSVYLPRLVIPMLPEPISNGICSLAEGVPRFTKSAFMSYDRDGNVLREHVGATLIRSAKRLTYLEAQALIDGDLREARKHAKTEPKYPDELIRVLREMDKCSKAIRARRKRQGMINLELPEVRLVYDDAGHVVDAEPEDDAFTHKLIEMFMVEANEVLARLFAGLEVPLLRRIHPEPPPGDVADLRRMAKVAGYSISKNPTRAELQALLEATAGTPAARAVHFAVLRTLTKAEYSPALVGHFALASDAYAHFTSPIRRYPDLTVHRALAAYLKLTDNGANRPRREGDRLRIGDELRTLGPVAGVLDQDELVEIGRHCTRTEMNAEAAEYSLRQFLILQLLVNHLGETFDGVVTGMSKAGVHVQIEKFLAEGLIKMEDLPAGRDRVSPRWPVGGGGGGRSGGGAGAGGGGGGGRWVIDQRSGALVNQSTGRSFNIGDRVKITIANIDLALRQMDLVISEPGSRESGKVKAAIAARAAKQKKAKELRGNTGYDEFFHRNRLTGDKRRAMRSKQHDQAKPQPRRPGKKKGS